MLVLPKLQKIKKMDRELAEQFFSGELSEDEIKELLARNRENIEKLRLEREAKRLKSLNLLREKKGKKKHQHDEEVLCFCLIWLPADDLYITDQVP